MRRAPTADVETHLLARHVDKRHVERLDVEIGDGGELLVAQVGEARVTAHREVRAVDLQLHASARDRLVLGAHRLGKGHHVRGVVAAEVAVLAEGCERARRGAAPEGLLDWHAGGLQPLEERGEVRVEAGCAKVGGPRRTRLWKIMGGHGRSWEVMGGHGRSSEVIGGHRRSWWVAAPVRAPGRRPRCASG